MWDPFEQTLNTFDKNNLVRARIEMLEGLKISDQSKKFLLNIGLPKLKVLLCEFDIDVPHLPTIEEYAKSQKMIFATQKRLRRIGWDGGTQICLSEEDMDKGSVYAVDIKKELTSRFINSNIEFFVGFLALYVEECKKYYGSSDSILFTAARKFENNLRELDPLAFADENNWWCCIVQQMKEGML